jgi:hypothetical protein
MTTAAMQLIRRDTKAMHVLTSYITKKKRQFTSDQINRLYILHKNNIINYFIYF